MSQRRYHGQTYHECPYCKYGYSVRDIHLGRCPCGGKYGYDLNDEPSIIKCFTCGRVSEKITARVREAEADQAANRLDLERHIGEKHRARQVYDRLQDIERDARRFAKWDPTLADPQNDEVWKTHELAVEYRALLREWWTLPNAEVTPLLLGPQPRYLLTAKGQYNPVAGKL